MGDLRPTAALSGPDLVGRPQRGKGLYLNGKPPEDLRRGVVWSGFLYLEVHSDAERMAGGREG